MHRTLKLFSIAVILYNSNSKFFSVSQASIKNGYYNVNFLAFACRFGRMVLLYLLKIMKKKELHNDSSAIKSSDMGVSFI